MADDCRSALADGDEGRERLDLGLLRAEAFGDVELLRSSLVASEASAEMTAANAAVRSTLAPMLRALDALLAATNAADDAAPPDVATIAAAQAALEDVLGAQAGIDRAFSRVETTLRAREKTVWRSAVVSGGGLVLLLIGGFAVVTGVSRRRLVNVDERRSGAEPGAEVFFERDGEWVAVMPRTEER